MVKRCGEGVCGACTVIIDGRAVRSCVISVGSVRDKEILTIEGLANNGELHPIQKAFVKHDALQCGFCTPGMILNAYSFDSMEYNLCRCGAHIRIIRAIEEAAQEMKGAV
jgi:aerobic-type carbon monoxide dehydrogenase small subunit (CoxS/CutS family)